MKLSGQVQTNSVEDVQDVPIRKKKLGGNPKEIQKNRAKKLGRVVDSSSDDSSDEEEADDDNDLKTIRIAKKPALPTAMPVSRNTSNGSNGYRRSGNDSVNNNRSSSSSSGSNSSGRPKRPTQRGDDSWKEDWGGWDDYGDNSGDSPYYPNRSPSPELQHMDYDPYEPDTTVTSHNVERGVSASSVSQISTLDSQIDAVTNATKSHVVNRKHSQAAPSNNIDAIVTNQNTWLKDSLFIKMFNSHDQLDQFYQTGWMLNLSALGSKRKLT